ncbi:MAG: sugar transferase [Oribacterium sp.]|nr:sugar transferase [Oribacterium sp.]
MYRKDSTGWIKHLDFIILDMLCLQLAFVLSFGLSGHGFDPYKTLFYRNMAMFIEIMDLVMLFMMGTLKNVLKRGYYKNFIVTVQHGLALGACTLLYLFMLQEGYQYSRLALILNIVIYILLTYLVREFWKCALHRQMEERGSRSLLLVVTADVADAVVKSMKENNYGCFKLAGLAIIDQDRIGQRIDDIEVVADMETAAEYVCKQWIDEVLIVTSSIVPYPKELIQQFTEIGVTVHLKLAKVKSVPGKKQFVEKIGDYTVLTTSINYASTRELMIKRLMDIAGGLVGCLVTAILFIFVAPAIYIASPGPIFFSQERVGKNGKRFKMYKFRSMYMDAEARKAELMKDNKLGDAKMFKLDFDPRVIGNKVMPDGSHKTGIGDFIRRTSIDEFPQFFNVLKGDMSIVGTRPPLISETNCYELHHKARLAIKPGITGMWQVSGRSDITDFEEVVRLDKEYIENWNIGLDIQILFKTVMVVLKKEGSM